MFSLIFTFIPKNKVNGADLFDLSGEDIRVEIEIEDIRIESAILKGIGLLKKGYYFFYHFFLGFTFF